MSNSCYILFNNNPLVVNVELANLLGLNESIILQQVHYWLEKNRKDGRNIRDGFVWTYNTYKDWQGQFPFWSDSTIKRTITALENTGLLISAKYNKGKFDRTKWYRINYTELNNLLISRPGQNDPIGNTGVSETSTDGMTNAKNKMPVKQDSSSPNASKARDIRLGQNDPIEDSKLTPSIVSNCPHPSGQNDPTNTRDYPETTTETTTTKAKNMFSDTTPMKNVVGVSDLNLDKGQKTKESFIARKQKLAADIKQVRVIFTNSGIRGLADHYIKALATSYTWEDLKKIAQVLQQKKEQGLIKNPAGLLMACPGVPEAILCGEFYPEVCAAPKKGNMSDYEIYIPPAIR